MQNVNYFINQTAKKNIDSSVEGKEPQETKDKGGQKQNTGFTLFQFGGEDKQTEEDIKIISLIPIYLEYLQYLKTHDFKIFSEYNTHLDNEDIGVKQAHTWETTPTDQSVLLEMNVTNTNNIEKMMNDLNTIEKNVNIKFRILLYYNFLKKKIFLLKIKINFL